jgi:DNA repair exonuclease SbcCD ATPase subunit
VIELGLYFVLGFVTAALIALVVLPAFWRRAYRLTRREIEATLPLSPTEIAAERDQLRSKFAVERVQLEQEAEKARQARQKAMADAGHKALRITALEDTVAARDAVIAGRDEKIGMLERTLVNARGVIEEQKAAIASNEHTMASLSGQLAALSGEHRELGETSDTRRVQIAALETNLDAQRARIGELDGELKTARASIRGLTEDLRTKDRGMRDLEKQLAVTSSKLASAEDIAERRAQIINERDAAVGALEEKLEALQREGRNRDDIIRRETRRADAADKMAADREQMAQKLKEDARTTAADLAKTIEKLKADRQKLQADLTESRSKAAQTQRELTALKRGGAAARVSDLRQKQAGVGT